jgi:hypothetical protein
VGIPVAGPLEAAIKTTLLLEALLEGQAEKLTGKAIDLALGGDLQALRLCLERLLPPCRERRIDLPLPDVQTGQDTANAFSLVLAATGDGRITPGEGQVVAEIIEARTRLTQGLDHDRRIAALEKAEAEDKEGRR